jgi:hypothetical protein
VIEKSAPFASACSGRSWGRLTPIFRQLANHPHAPGVRHLSLRPHEYDAHRNRSLQIGAGRHERAAPPVHAELHDVARILVFHKEVVAAGIESEMTGVFSSGVGLARGRQLAVGRDREYRGAKGLFRAGEPGGGGPPLPARPLALANVDEASPRRQGYLQTSAQ